MVNIIKEIFEKELKNLNNKKDRIRKAYIDFLFTEEEYKEETILIEKQTRSDRRINDYFEHISNDKEHDLTCEIIIELGEMDYWSNKLDTEKVKGNENIEKDDFEI